MAAPHVQHVTAQAVTPDQLLPYVRAVSAMRSSMVGDCLLHRHEGTAVLVGYPLHDPRDSVALDAALDATLTLPGITHLTILAASRPKAAPDHALSTEDSYWSVPLPPLPPRQKLRHMLHRAAREVNIHSAFGPDCWTEEHQALVQSYIQTRPLEPGMRHIFQQLAHYLAAAPEALLWSARDAQDKLVGCAVGDYSALSTAFYMFAFRLPAAPPGVSDALLGAVLNEGTRRGHTLCNLGLGVHAQIAFFKQKWQATAFLPCVQTSWETRAPKTRWFSRLFS